MFMYILIFMVCAGVGIYLSRKIDENWEEGLYDHLYYDDGEDEYDEEDDYESDSEEVEPESEHNSESELKDLDDLDRNK
ncbi:hypothetical protein F10086_35 [Staphylococcus phage vB_SauM_JDF86]|nr:hypothetical protein F10086_35 [Staphylococcus phage vB_SauM_JDF86]